MSTISKKILIVEDDLIAAEYLKEFLRSKDYDVPDVVDTGKEAVKQALLFKPDLILMDIMLQDQMTGTEAALQIHQNNPKIKIIFLTAYSEEEMIESAMDSKADAYLLKPYRENEILATIKLQFAESHIKKTEDPENIFLTDGYRYNTQLHRLFKGDEEIPLTKKLLKLIEILAKNKNVSVSNEQICTYIWGEQKSGKTLRSLIHRIRSTIDADLIQNINGMGYKIV